jgi:hypothetical protein
VFLSKIRRRFKALSLAHSAPSFSALFASFDLSGQNSLSPAEFKLAVRSGLNISSRELTDRDIEILLKTLDTDKVRASDASAKKVLLLSSVPLTSGGWSAY